MELVGDIEEAIASASSKSSATLTLRKAEYAPISLPSLIAPASYFHRLPANQPHRTRWDPRSPAASGGFHPVAVASYVFEQLEPACSLQSHALTYMRSDLTASLRDSTAELLREDPAAPMEGLAVLPNRPRQHSKESLSPVLGFERVKLRRRVRARKGDEVQVECAHEGGP